VIALQGKITSLCYRAGGMDAATNNLNLNKKKADTLKRHQQPA